MQFRITALDPDDIDEQFCQKQESQEISVRRNCHTVSRVITCRDTVVSGMTKVVKGMKMMGVV